MSRCLDTFKAIFSKSGNQVLDETLLVCRVHEKSLFCLTKQHVTAKADVRASTAPIRPPKMGHVFGRWPVIVAVKDHNSFSIHANDKVVGLDVLHCDFLSGNFLGFADARGYNSNHSHPMERVLAIDGRCIVISVIRRFREIDSMEYRSV